MTTLPLQKVIIPGYFSRIFRRRSDPVRGLALKVRRGQERSFRDLHAAYQAFDRSHNPECSRALAKEIVNVATREVGPGETLAKKIEQVTAATLSNWVRDRRRNVLVSDIYTEMQQSAYRQEGIHHQEALKAPFTREFKRFLSDVQGGRAEPITQILEEKKQAKAEELAFNIASWKSQREVYQGRLTVIQKALLSAKQGYELLVLMRQDLVEKISDGATPLQRNEYQKVWKALQKAAFTVDHLRMEKESLLSGIKSCNSKLDSITSQINEYDLDTISARGKEIMRQAGEKGIAVQVDDLIPVTFPDHAKRALTQAFLVEADR